MNDEWSQVAANAIAFAAEMSRENVRIATAEFMRPSVLYRPKLLIDGNQWCAIYGENLQDGVAGFGKSPEEAMWKFDQAWATPLTPPTRCAWAAPINTCPITLDELGQAR